MEIPSCSRYPIEFSLHGNGQFLLPIEIYSVFSHDAGVESHIESVISQSAYTRDGVNFQIPPKPLRRFIIRCDSPPTEEFHA